MTLHDVTSEKLASFFDAQKGEKPSMFLASVVIKRHFGGHTESQESSSLPVAKHFLGLSLAKRRLMFSLWLHHFTTLSTLWKEVGIIEKEGGLPLFDT